MKKLRTDARKQTACKVCQEKGSSMSKLFYPDFFNDVFGPIMQPGSSGSFAGTSRVGRIARYTLASEPKMVRILFNPSDHHLKVLGNMMDDRAYLGGLQDFATDDIRLFTAHEEARTRGISYEFAELDQDVGDPGSVTFELTGKNGDTASLTARSIGGGMVCTYLINGFPIHWQADTNAVLAWTEKEGRKRLDEGATALEERHADFVQKQYAADQTGHEAVFLEFSNMPEKSELKAVFGNQEYRIFPALLPVVTTKDRKPQLFRTVEEWRQVAKERGITFVQAAIEYEKNFSGWTQERIWEYFEKIESIFEAQVHSLERMGYENAADTPNLPIYGKNWDLYLREGNPLADDLTRHIITHAMATNAKVPGVLIVPGPMGTGGGYLYSALSAVAEKIGASHQKIIESLIVAAGLGAIAFTHCDASGNSGCVGESGVCCAMGSGAVTYLAGGDGIQVERAASMALQANIGIPCDPIPGGREFPCITRTVRAAVTMPLYADLALSGMDPIIPYHEMLYAIRRNKEMSPQACLHDGVNVCPSAMRCQEFLEGDLMAGKMKYEA